jgi:glucose-6-phosphate 1-epimerase
MPGAAPPLPPAAAGVMTGDMPNEPVLPASARLVMVEGNLPALRVATPLCRGEVLLHGAHVTRWQPAGHAEVLWLSSRSHMTESKPVRGGVPLCWPWFGPHGEDQSLPAHGHARVRRWRLDSVAEDADGVVTATLADAGGPLPGFAHAWDLRLTVRFGSVLDVALRVANPGSAPFRCSDALHTYLGIGDVRQCAIAGLAGTTVHDKTRQGQRRIVGDAPLRLDAWTDQVHLSHAGAVTVTDPLLRRAITVSKRGSASTVIWNPWRDMATAMADFDGAQWPGMLCVEAANALENAYEVAPSSAHVTATSLAVAHLP